MKVLTKIGVEIHLILNKEEALWLKVLVQNPWPHLSTEKDVESQKDETMRRLFWDACSKLQPHYDSKETFEYDVPF